MKGFLCCLWAPIVGLCLCVCSCSRSSSSSAYQRWAEENHRIKVLSTTAMIDDIVGKVGGDRIVHLPLITGEIDPHSYELVKGDDEKLSLAAVVFCNGLGLEHGASLRYQLEHHPHAVGVGNAVLSRFPEKIIHIGGEIDPHLWMDLSLFSEIIDPIMHALIEQDPEGKEIYQANALACKAEMLTNHVQIVKEFQSIPEEKRYLVTSHDAFNYFARAYLATEEEVMENRWQSRFDAPEGLAPDGQLGAADIRQVVDHLMAHQISVVFPESNVSRDSLNKIIQVCAKKKLNVAISDVSLYGDAMGTEDAGNYLGMMRHNAQALVHAWSFSESGGP